MRVAIFYFYNQGLPKFKQLVCLRCLLLFKIFILFLLIFNIKLIISNNQGGQLLGKLKCIEYRVGPRFCVTLYASQARH